MCRQKMSIYFNEICINEEMLSIYIYIYIYIYQSAQVGCERISISKQIFSGLTSRHVVMSKLKSAVCPSNDA